MTRKQRSFSSELKQEAVSLVLDQGYTAIRRWVNQLAEERDGVTPKGKALTPEQRRIQELEARRKRLEMEKDIVRKATALLMSDDMNRTR